MLRFFFLASSNTTIIASATISAALPAVIICFNVFSVGLAHKRSITFQLLIFYNTTLLLIDWIITKDHNSTGLVMMKNEWPLNPWPQNVLTAQKEFRLTILRLYVYDVHKPIRIGLYSHFLSVYLPKIKSRLTIIIVAIRYPGFFIRPILCLFIIRESFRCYSTLVILWKWQQVKYSSSWDLKKKKTKLRGFSIRV